MNRTDVERLVEAELARVPEAVWSALDKVNPFRVQSSDEFEQELPVGLMVANLAIGFASVLLIRRGAGYPRAARS